MSRISKNTIDEKSQRRANEISDYISKNPECKQEGQQHQVFVNKTKKNMDVYELPRYLLRLNPENWRFKAEFNIIRLSRQKLGKSLELDPDVEEDEKTIRDLLKGIKPKNEQRKQRYDELKKDFIANSTNGSNGQTTPGIILFDGTYINGNRRDTILDDLSKNPPEGYSPSNFQIIRVARLPENVSQADIKANETREQISIDSRERYDYTNSALMVADYMQHLVKIEKLTTSAAIKQITNQVFGLVERDIQNYINFKKIADNFLNTIGKPGQYDYIQEASKGQDEGGIVQTLKEVGEQTQTIKKLKISPTKTSQLIKALYAFAWYSKEKPKQRDRTGKLKPLNFNHRAFRIFKKEVFDSEASMNKLLESGTIDKINWKQPQDHALAFSSDIIRAQNVSQTEKSLLLPLVSLEDAADKLSQINKDMNSSNGEKIKSQIQQNGLKYIQKIKNDISEISQKMDTHIKKK